MRRATYFYLLLLFRLSGAEIHHFLRWFHTRLSRLTKEPAVGEFTVVVLKRISHRSVVTSCTYGLCTLDCSGVVDLLSEHEIVLGAIEKTAFCLAAGKRAFFRNGAAALTVSAGVVYGVDWFKRRMIKQSQERKRGSGAPRP